MGDPLKMNGTDPFKAAAEIAVARMNHAHEQKVREESRRERELGVLRSRAASGFERGANAAMRLTRPRLLDQIYDEMAKMFLIELGRDGKRIRDAVYAAIDRDLEISLEVMGGQVEMMVVRAEIPRSVVSYAITPRVFDQLAFDERFR